MVLTQLLLCLLPPMVATLSGSGSGSGDGAFDQTLAQNITVLGFFPYSAVYDDSSDVRLPNGTFLEAAAAFALDTIDEKSAMLRGYSLELLFLDSGCDKARVAWQLGQVTTMEDPIVVLGPACEESALLAAGMADSHLNTILMSYAASSVQLRNTKAYRNFFRTVPSYSQYSTAVFAISKTFSWVKFCVVSDEDHYFVEAVESVVTLGESARNVNILQRVSISNVPYLTNTSCRIFFVMVSKEDIPKVMCDAYHENLFGSAYEWIFFGEVDEDNVLDSTLTQCSSSQLQQALQYSLVCTFVPDPINSKSVSGLDKDSFVSEYNDYLRAHDLDASELEGVDPDYHFSIAAFDAVWALAIGLNLSVSILQERGLSLANYCPTCKREVSDIVISAFQSVNFVGVARQIRFNSTSHSPETMIKIVQIQNGRIVPIALYNSSTDGLNLNYYGNSILWVDGKPPSDSPIQATSYPPLPIEVIMTFIATVGITICLFFLVVNVYYRNEKVLKASSPPFNNIIIAGCTLGFISVILFSIDVRYGIPTEAFVYICNLHPWLISFSFTLSFGTLFSKTWRVYAVFRNPWSKRRIYRNSTLYIFIAVMLLIDVVLLMPQAIIDPMFLYNETVITPAVVTIIPYCRSDSNLFFLWIGLLLVYKGLLLALGVFLALQIRKIKSKAFNDAKPIGLSVYGVVVTAGFGVPVAFFTMFSGQIEVSYIITTVTISTCAFTVLIFVFVPKLLLLRTHKQKKKKGIKVDFVTGGTSVFQSTWRKLSKGKYDMARKALPYSLTAPLLTESTVAPPTSHTTEVETLND